MSMTLPKAWRIAPAAPGSFVRNSSSISPILAQVLYNRGLSDPAQIPAYLNGGEIAAGSFLSLRRTANSSIDRALARIKQAIRTGEQIAVYGDFDADGVTSTALMMQVLRSLGANVIPYIPHRVDEGYGVNSEALLRLSRSGVRLVITVDCGIRSVDEVDEGRRYGLDIIITDHHSLGPDLPRAYALINPKLDDLDYSEDMLAGVGVAFRLCEALLTISGSNGIRRSSAGPRIAPEDLLDLVAIGTVADLAPLNRSENRALVKRGLMALNEAKRPGIRALMEVAGLRQGQVKSESIGFGLGPRINAAGRLESAMIAYQLLATDDDQEAYRLARRLQDLNTLRQELTRTAQESIRTALNLEMMQSPLIFASGHFQPGIVGLVAGRLTEEFYRPAIVMEMGDTESRASCRSIPQFDITGALDECAGLLVRHGGHAQAAGFTVRNENIPALQAQLSEIAARSLEGTALIPTLDIDCELDPADMTLSLAETLQLLEPTGHDNPPPVFATRGMRISDVRTVGREEQHLKLRLERSHSAPIDAIGFHLGGGDWRVGDYVDVAYTLDINEWNNSRTVQLKLQDVRMHQPKDE